MSPEMIDITDMMCRIFRLAEIKWNKTPAEVSVLFQKFNVLEFISDCYGSLHLSSDLYALADIENILYNNRVTMEISHDQPTNKMKEHCAITTMRRMLEKYSDINGISYKEAFFQFTNSRAYLALFDYDTGIWSEGPDYLMNFFEDTI